MTAKSLSEIVREYVSTRPCILEALKMRIANYSALARLIAEYCIKENLEVKVSTPAIKMALKRFVEKLSAEYSSLESKILKILASSSLYLINDITVFTVEGQLTHSFSDKIAALKPRFLQLTQSLGYVTVMIDQETFEKLKKFLGKTLLNAHTVEVLRDQTAILIKSPREIIETPGVIAHMLSALAHHGVNITQFISCHTDTILIINRREALKAYTVLEKLILSARRLVKTSA